MDIFVLSQFLSWVVKTQLNHWTKRWSAPNGRAASGGALAPKLLRAIWVGLLPPQIVTVYPKNPLFPLFLWDLMSETSNFGSDKVDDELTTLKNLRCCTLVVGEKIAERMKHIHNLIHSTAKDFRKLINSSTQNHAVRHSSCIPKELSTVAEKRSKSKIVTHHSKQYCENKHDGKSCLWRETNPGIVQKESHQRVDRSCFAALLFLLLLRYHAPPSYFQWPPCLPLAIRSRFSGTPAHTNCLPGQFSLAFCAYPTLTATHVETQEKLLPHWPGCHSSMCFLSRLWTHLLHSRYLTSLMVPCAVAT